MTNVELEAAALKIEDLKVELARLQHNAEDDSAHIRNLEVDLHTARRALAAQEVDSSAKIKHLEDEVLALKETIVKLAVAQEPRVTQEPIHVAGQLTPKAAGSLLGQMIASEEAAQEKEWRG